MQFFITGIGTEVGKTVTSAFLCKVLDADYWKPVQAGELQSSDSLKVEQWSQRAPGRVHPEAFRLSTPASPHYAAAVDGVEICVQDVELPFTNHRPLIVEGAGGLMVPLNEQETMLDLVAHLDLPVVLVARNYLGSINHTLLSIEALKQAGIAIAGVVYSGANYRDNIEIIETHSGVRTICQLPELTEINAEVIEQLALTTTVFPFWTK